VLSIIEVMIMDHRLSTEMPLDPFQGAEKGLDHDDLPRPTTLEIKYGREKRINESGEEWGSEVY
jgi:hypothetical protein